MHRILMTLLLTACAFTHAQAGDVATVNGKAIKDSLVDYIVKEAKAQGKEINEEERANLIERIIATTVLEQEAMKSPATKTAEFLAHEELTLREIRVKALIDDFVSKHPIDEKSLNEAYEQLKSQTGTKEYRASHILVKTEDEAKALIAQLEKGADFAKLAKEKSLDTSKNQGGDLGWFPPESMVKPFADAVVQLQPGKHTGVPVETEFGWHVIKLAEIRDAVPPSLDAVRKELTNQLQSQQIDKYVADLMAKAKIINNTKPKSGK